MVLSNKKLKQKLRAEVLAKTVAEIGSNKRTPDSNSEPQSLKSLLDSVSLKPRLSKREKRRRTLPFSKGLNRGNEEKGQKVEEEEEKSEEVEKRKKKKRKRHEENVKEVETTWEKRQKNKKKKNKAKREKNASEEEGVLQVENGAESQVKEDVATKVYVGGIPYRYTEDDIRYYFEGCGTITDVDCMKFPDSGKFRGIAIITFETEAAAKEALALDRADMGGMQLTIQPYKSTRANNKVTGFAPKMVEGYNRIYVGNLSWDITEDDLKKFFSDCNVSSIRFGVNKETREFRGYAHVDFSDSVSVAMALKLDQEIVRGRPVKISCAVPKKGVKTQSTARPTSDEVPTSHEAPPTKKAPASNEAPPTIGNEADNGGGSNVCSGKMRRRTCYECGQKGHLSSACPNKKTADPTPASDEAPPTKEAPASNEEQLEADNGGGSNVSSGKMRRRTCYECAQKGHLSSACPNKKTLDPTPASDEAPASNESQPSTGKADNGGGSNVSSGKLRRRTCYECGQKGHLSSACPNKKTADTTNTNTINH